jgi:hypothetical protein
MPMQFKEGLIFLPGEKAVYKPDDKAEWEECVVKRLVPNKDNVASGYEIKLSGSKKTVVCDLTKLAVTPSK